MHWTKLWLWGPMHERRLAGSSGYPIEGELEVIARSSVLGNLGTHIDFVLLVADEEVVHHACFMKIPKADHVFHPLDRGWVHWAHHVHVPGRDPVLLKKERQKF